MIYIVVFLLQLSKCLASKFWNVDVESITVHISSFMKSNQNGSSHTYEWLDLNFFNLIATNEIIVLLLRQYGINWQKWEL